MYRTRCVSNSSSASVRMRIGLSTNKAFWELAVRVHVICESTQSKDIKNTTMATRKPTGNAGNDRH